MKKGEEKGVQMLHFYIFKLFISILIIARDALHSGSRSLEMKSNDAPQTERIC